MSHELSDMIDPTKLNPGLALNRVKSISGIAGVKNNSLGMTQQ